MCVFIISWNESPDAGAASVFEVPDDFNWREDPHWETYIENADPIYTSRASTEDAALRLARIIARNQGYQIVED